MVWMRGRSGKAPRRNDLTSRYLGGDLEDEEPQSRQRFSERSKRAELEKILRTALMRAEAGAADGNVETLPVGQVLQVYSLFSEVEHEGKVFLCVVRKTLARVSETPIIVGDRVRFRELDLIDEQGRPQAVIEQVLPRETVLTRADSFKGTEQHPIVANAQQMLIVASLTDPRVRWGLVDRMIVAASGGHLRPVVCLNKVDLAEPAEVADADAVLRHYQSLGVTTLKTSAPQQSGLEELRELLRDQVTVLAGHSGVGKSSLINSIQPHLRLRIGSISDYTGKGRHTTTFARRYELDFGGAVIDTPGVKVFGLWGVKRANLSEFFPDVVDGTAPAWRRESYERISESLPQ